MRFGQLGAVVGLFCLCTFPAWGAVIDVRFPQQMYTAVANQDFTVTVVFDAVAGTPGEDPAPLGLFSVGVALRFDPAKAQVLDVSSVVLPAALNSNGAGGPADKTATAGLAGAAGALDLSATSGYAGTLLTTVTLRNLATTGTYALSLERYYPTKTNFLDYGGNDLDGQIAFGSALVAVPEPAQASALMVVLGAVLSRRRRRRTARPEAAHLPR
jgi:hypothetical protein